MPIAEYESIESLKELTGTEIAVSDWLQISQDQINRFAEVTNDRQWIHTDPVRCAKESPFGVPIAHGFLTLALIPGLHAGAIRLRQAFKTVINVGMRKVRFMSAVPVGSHVRLRETVVSVFEVKGGWQVNMKMTIDIKETGKPACILESATRYYA